MFLKQTPLKKTNFLSGLKLKFSNENNFICSFKPEKFNVYDFVFQEIPLIKRAKHQVTHTGPHMILKVLGDSTEMKVHYNHIKPFIIPDTNSWTLNVQHLKTAKNTNTQLSISLRYFASLIKIKEELHGYQVQREPEKQTYV